MIDGFICAIYTIIVIAFAFLNENDTHSRFAGRWLAIYAIWFLFMWWIK